MTDEEKTKLAANLDSLRFKAPVEPSPLVFPQDVCEYLEGQPCMSLPEQEKLEDYTAIWTTLARQELIAYIFAMAKNAGVGWPENGAPFLEIDMPCGNTFLAQTPGDMPYESLPCPCGDPKHWFVKYELVDNRTPQRVADA